MRGSIPTTRRGMTPAATSHRSSTSKSLRPQRRLDGSSGANALTQREQKRKARKVHCGCTRPVENDVDVSIGQRIALAQHILAIRQMPLDVGEPRAEALTMHRLRVFRCGRMK